VYRASSKKTHKEQLAVSGRDNYTRAIEFGGPAYLPCTVGVDLDWLHGKDPGALARIRELSYCMRDDLQGGLHGAGARQSESEENGVSRWQDEWGTGWEDDGHGAKTETYPLESGYDALDGYAFPDPHLPGRFDEFHRVLAGRGDRYARSTVWFTLFERLWMLRGFENMLIDPYDHEREFCALRDRVVDYSLVLIDELVAGGVDAVFFSDDWGSQRGLLMAPDDWRRFYRPAYQRIFDRVRSGGAHVWMHLCGDITAILPDLVDLGLNVLNPVQPQAMDVKQLARDFGGKLCFNGGVDVQGTLINGTPDEVRREVHDRVELFGRYQGGYIGGTSHSVMPETPLENVVALLEAFLEHHNPTG
jgi:uroporphyrinogen decarboxylase